MLNNKDYIKHTQNYEHSLKFLKDIIINIEAYPELLNIENEPNKIDKLKIKKSNIKKLKKYLNKIESLIKATKDKTNDHNINKRLEYLNDSNLISLYKKELKLTEKKIINLQKKIKKELKNLDKSLFMYIEVIKNKKGYSITETLNNKITVNDIFNKVSIDELIKDLKLEDYEEYFFYEYGSSNLDSKYYELYNFKDKEEEQKLREIVYPNLKIIKSLNKLNNNQSLSLLNEGYLISNLLIRKKQLQNLIEYINKKNYKYTILYLTNKIKKIDDILFQKQKRIEIELETEISKYKFNKDNLSSTEEHLLNTILNSSKKEFEDKLNYKNNSITYQEVLQDNLEKYQENTLKEKYNLNLSLKEANKLLYKKKIPKQNKK